MLDVINRVLVATLGTYCVAPGSVPPAAAGWYSADAIRGCSFDFKWHGSVLSMIQCTFGVLLAVGTRNRAYVVIVCSATDVL